jgi:hypothetical protein
VHLIIPGQGGVAVTLQTKPGVISGQLTVTISNSTEPGIVSPIISIDLDDGRQPNGDLELCFFVEEQDVKKLQLASFDEQDDCWKEEDDVQVEDSRVNEETGVTELLVCGEVDHFTDFSILLSSEDGASVCSGEAGDGDLQLLIIILAASCIGLAILVILAVMAAHHKCANFRRAIQGSEATRVEKLREITKQKYQGNDHLDTECVESHIP